MHVHRIYNIVNREINGTECYSTIKASHISLCFRTGGKFLKKHKRFLTSSSKAHLLISFQEYMQVFKIKNAALPPLHELTCKEYRKILILGDTESNAGKAATTRLCLCFVPAPEEQWLVLEKYCTKPMHVCTSLFSPSLM